MSQMALFCSIYSRTASCRDFDDLFIKWDFCAEINAECESNLYHVRKRCDELMVFIGWYFMGLNLRSFILRIARLMFVTLYRYFWNKNSVLNKWCSLYISHISIELPTYWPEVSDFMQTLYFERKKLLAYHDVYHTYLISTSLGLMSLISSVRKDWKIIRHKIYVVDN